MSLGSLPPRFIEFRLSKARRLFLFRTEWYGIIPPESR